MVTEKYGFGLQAAFAIEEEAKFTNATEAAIAAQNVGYGFIVAFRQAGNRVYKSILAWDAKVISFNEACQLYGKDPEKMNIILCSPSTTVFIISPVGANMEEILFPFTPFNRLTMVKLSELV